jgi:SAM-dependent methyltransferase
MTRTIEVSCLGLRCGNGANGIEFAPLSELLAACAVRLRGARILQLGTRGCFGFSELLETYRPARLVAYEFGEARAAAGPRGAAAMPVAQPIPEPDRTFGAVFAYGLLDMAQHWDELLPEIARVLQPSGVLIVQVASHGADSAPRIARLSTALQEAGLAPAIHQRQAGLAEVLIARRA